MPTLWAQAPAALRGSGRGSADSRYYFTPGRSRCGGRSVGFDIKQTWAQILTPPCPRSTLSLCFSESQFPHLSNGPMRPTSWDSVRVMGEAHSLVLAQEGA